MSIHSNDGLNAVCGESSGNRCENNSNSEDINNINNENIDKKLVMQELALALHDVHNNNEITDNEQTKLNNAETYERKEKPVEEDSDTSEEDVDAFDDDDDARKYADYSSTCYQQEQSQQQHLEKYKIVNTKDIVVAMALNWQSDSDFNFSCTATCSSNSSHEDSETQLLNEQTATRRRLRRSSIGMQRRAAFRQRKLDSVSTWRYLR